MNAKSKIILIVSFLLLISLTGLYFVIQSWMPFMWFLVVPGLLGILAWVGMNQRLLFDFFTLKTTKQGFNMGALILIALGFLVVFNFLAVKYNHSFDLSVAGQFSLSEQSKKIIDSLDSDIEIKFFYKDGLEGIENAKKSFGNMVRLYQEHSPRVHLEYVEMNSRPKLTQEFGANKGSGEGFVSYKGQKNRIETQSFGSNQVYTEQELTNALIKSTRKEKKKVYFLQGHGERSLVEEKSETAVTSLKQLLEKNSILVEELNLVTKTAVPSDANAVLILNPLTEIQKFELAAISNYLKAGGSVVITIDRNINKSIETFLEIFGIKPRTDLIFNILNSPMGQVVNAQQPTAVVHYSAVSDITKMFTMNNSTVYVQPRAFDVLSIPTTMKAEVLVKTPEASVALQSVESSDYKGQPQSYNLAYDITGQLEDKNDQAMRLVVYGDTDFLSNQFIYQNSNKDLILNTVSSLIKETDLVSISAKQPQATKMIMTVPDFNQYFKFIVVGIFIPIPFIFLVISLIIWLRRRHA